MFLDPPAEPDEPWFAVRCLFSHSGLAEEDDGHLYEERITIWRAASFEEAFAFAEAEAHDYATDLCRFVEVIDGYHLFEPAVGHGSEVWSKMRGSPLDSEAYVRTFCATPGDRSMPGDVDPGRPSAGADGA